MSHVRAEFSETATPREIQRVLSDHRVGAPEKQTMKTQTVAGNKAQTPGKVPGNSRPRQRLQDRWVGEGHPRASRALFRAAKVWAAMSGRDFVTPDDIQKLAQPVLAHRLLLSNEARISGTSAAEILSEIVNRLPVPPYAGEEFHGN